MSSSKSWILKVYCEILMFVDLNSWWHVIGGWENGAVFSLNTQETGHDHSMLPLWCCHFCCWGALLLYQCCTPTSSNQSSQWISHEHVEKKVWLYFPVWEIGSQRFSWWENTGILYERPVCSGSPRVGQRDN